jgi:hypothetical protein
MFFAGVVLLFLASVLLSWYVAHARLPFAERALGFHAFGSVVLGIGILALIVGLGLIWGATSFLGAAIAGLVFYFLLPFLTGPLLRALGALPALDLAPDRKGRIPILTAMEKSYFEHRYRYPGKMEMAYLFLTLRSRYIEKAENRIWEIVHRCTTLEDAMVEAARIDTGDEGGVEARRVLEACPMCSKCGEHRAFRSGDPLCYGCREYGDMKVCHYCHLYWPRDARCCSACGQPLSDVTPGSPRANT